MKILILFASSEGQTRKIARFIAERLDAQGHETVSVDAAEVGTEFQMPMVDAVIVAASVHVGTYQKSVVGIVEANRPILDAVPTAFVSVSLAASGGPADLKDAEACAGRFSEKTGWAPGRVEHVAGTLAYSQYNFVTRWMMWFIARRHGLPTDRRHDTELTDWAAVERFADSFGRGLQPPE